MRLDTAAKLAQQLVTAMTPYCSRIEIAGSIRRGKPEVKDIEIVALPRWVDEAVAGDLFGETVPRSLLYRWATGAGDTSTDSAAALGIQWIKPGTSGIVPWQPREDGRYWRGRLAVPGEADGPDDPVASDSSGVNLDLFLPESPENWGLILMVRTGSREFGTGVAMHARRVGLRLEDGWLWEGERRIPTPEEQDVFQALNLAWVEPQDRIGVDDVRNAPPVVTTSVNKSNVPSALERAGRAGRARSARTGSGKGGAKPQ